MTLTNALIAITMAASFATSYAELPAQTAPPPRAICLQANSDFHKRNPDGAVPLLLQELKPVARGHYRSGEHPYTVWCIRALRAITRKDFRAPTKAKLSEEERHWLRLDQRGHIVFFGTWMSRDSLWVAPTDAQEKIISQWHEWFKQEGRTQKFTYDKDFDNWYF